MTGTALDVLSFLFLGFFLGMRHATDADHVGGNQGIAETLGSSAAWTIINTPGASNGAGKIVSHLHADRFQMRRGANPGDLQQVR